MTFVGIILISFTPGLFWLWFYLRKDSYRPAPRRLIAITFGLGCLATIPAGVVGRIALGDSFLAEGAGFEGLAAGMLFVVGPVEELCKFAAVRFKAYRSPYFDEPMDGLVYAVAASLGFASLENLLYVFEFGPEVMLVRAPLSTVAHLVFGGIWGYALGVHHASGRRRPLLVAGCLALGACTHAIFNILLIAPLTIPMTAPLMIPMAIALTVGGAVWVFRRFEWGQRISPFRYRRNYPETACPSCGRRIRAMSRFCRFCGAPVVSRQGKLFCGNCGTGNRPDAGYCTGCGDRLLRS